MTNNMLNFARSNSYELNKLLHKKNAELPMEVTEFGISMEIKPLHLLNAIVPIEFTEFGISMEVKLVQLENV